MKYIPTNGWTKARILEVIRVRPFEEAATVPDLGAGGLDKCAYRAPNGNKCGVGLFIPDVHEGQKLKGAVDTLLFLYPDLKPHMPLETSALRMLQNVHDSFANRHRARTAMLEWVEAHVENDGVCVAVAPVAGGVV